jgi:uroporphyrinogen decarboxylase
MRRSVSHRQRLENCLSGTSVDGAPVALWRHFPVDDQRPDTLARAHLNFQSTFDFDLLKVTPASSYMAKDWGVRDEWRGATEGTREYTHRVINSPDDWEKLSVLDPYQGSMGATIEALQMITKELDSQTPVIQTIFSPLSQAKNLVGREKLIVHLRQYPQAVHDGLKIIAESTRRYVEAIRGTGIAGLFYAVQHAQYGLLSLGEYAEFGRYYDMQVLEPAKDFWLNLLHLHGEDIMFDRFMDYPVAIINWHDQETQPSLADAQALFNGAVCGGLQREQALVLGTPDQIRKEAHAAAQATGGQHFILGTGCVVPIHAPYGNILAARHAFD